MIFVHRSPSDYFVFASPSYTNSDLSYYFSSGCDDET